MNISNEEKRLVDEIIITGIRIYEAYSNVSNSETINYLKRMIAYEEWVYSRLKLDILKCSAIISYVQKKYIEDYFTLPDFIMTDTNTKANYMGSVNRILNMIKYLSLGFYYVENGHLTFVLDKLIQITYSEFIFASQRYPNFRDAISYYAFINLSESKTIEKKALENNLQPFSFYEDNLIFFVELKKIKEVMDLARKEKVELSEVPIPNIKVSDVYVNALKNIVTPGLVIIFKKMMAMLSNQSTDLTNNFSFIILLVEFKARLAMYPKIEMYKLYSEYIRRIRIATDDNADVIDIFEEALNEIEVGIIPRITNIPVEALPNR